MKLTGTYRKLVRDTTINDKTLLSTDYLNHFNELIMMLDMVGDMPDMLEEAEDWAPKTYQDHFRDSAFTHKDLAVWAYEHAPDEFREPMDDCTTRMDTEITEGLVEFRKLVDSGDEDTLRSKVADLTLLLRGRIDTMSALINGAMDAEGYQTALNSEAPSEHGEIVMDQSAIDSLFD